MSEKYLGLPFDILGCCVVLSFLHHENERAQSEAACGCTFANYWIHGGMLQINSEKMSKSLGNFLLLRDVLKTTDARVLRMLMLQTHYRSPLDFSDERLQEAQSALGRLTNFVNNTEWLCSNPVQEPSMLDLDVYRQAIDTMRDSFVEAMDDDFNTAGALGAIFTFVSEANSMLADACVCCQNAEAVALGAQAVAELLGVLGFELQDSQGAEDDSASEVIALASSLAGYGGSDGEEAIQSLLDCRAAARKEKNFSLADQIRDELGALGYTIEDTPQGARVMRG